MFAGRVGPNPRPLFWERGLGDARTHTHTRTHAHARTHAGHGARGGPLLLFGVGVLCHCVLVSGVVEGENIDWFRMKTKQKQRQVQVTAA